MKKDFFDLMYKLMEKNENIYLLFVGLGYPRYDEFKLFFPDRVINTEASEQTALDIAVGLAYAGKMPFVYTITPFLLRGFETIRTYINHEKLNVKLIGAGRDLDYGHDGFSHTAEDLPKILSTLENLCQYYPKDKKQLTNDLNMSVIDPFPVFISLKR
jgi:transketolase